MQDEINYEKYTERIIEGLFSGVENADFSKEDVRFKYDNFVSEYIRPRLTWSLVQPDNIRFTKREAKFLVSYLCKSSLEDLGLNSNDVKMVIKPAEDMLGFHLFKRNYKDVKNYPMGYTQKWKNKITYSDFLMKDLCSGDSKKAFRAIRTIYHETKHMEQGDSKKNELFNYLYYMEAITESKDMRFYKNNYRTCYNEVDAEDYGFRKAVKEFKPIAKILGKEHIQKETDRIYKNKFENVKTVFRDRENRRSTEIPVGHRIHVMDLLVEDALRNRKRGTKVPDVIKKFFLSDGRYKPDCVLLRDVESRIASTESDFKKKELMLEYIFVMKNRYSDDYLGDIKEIEDYAKYSTPEVQYIAKHVVEEKRKMLELGEVMDTYTRSGMRKILKSKGICGNDAVNKVKKLFLPEKDLDITLEDIVEEVKENAKEQNKANGRFLLDEASSEKSIMDEYKVSLDERMQNKSQMQDKNTIARTDRKNNMDR